MTANGMGDLPRIIIAQGGGEGACRGGGAAPLERANRCRSARQEGVKCTFRGGVERPAARWTPKETHDDHNRIIILPPRGPTAFSFAGFSSLQDGLVRRATVGRNRT